MNTLLTRKVIAVLFCALFTLRCIGAEPLNYTPTQANVRYGKYDRDVLDYFRAETAKPAPVIIYYHGGGWIGGDKKTVNPAPILKAGISLVAANYRFTTGTPDAAPYPAPMLDSARVVQFVRSKAEEWHIDPNRIALTGSSAGAVISMWIAYHDDMVKSDSTDPIERFSTRVTCIVPMSGPTTLDPKLILQRVGGPPSSHPALLPFFNVKSVAELDTPEKQKLIADASPLNLVTKDSPPTFMVYAIGLGGTPLPPETSANIYIHHGEFGRMLKEKLDAAGVENVLQTGGDGSDPQAMWAFLFKHLKPELAPTGK
jgi:acetyl esterase/lipase